MNLQHGLRWCPVCGHALAITIVTNRESDFTICVHCLAPLRLPAPHEPWFTKVHLEDVSPAEREAFDATIRLVMETREQQRRRREAQQ